jgi:hypothetical protein
MKTVEELAKERADLERARINDERRAKRVKILLSHIEAITRSENRIQD